MNQEKTNKWEGRISINYAKFNDGHLNVCWSCENCGFGQLDIIVNRDKDTLLEDIVISTKEYLIFTECMGEEFAREVLKKLIDYIFDNGYIGE